MKTSDTKTTSTLQHTKPENTPFIDKEERNAFFSEESTSYYPHSVGVLSPPGGGKGGDFFFHPIQTKLTIGQPDDPYEREADAIADKIISGQSLGGTALTPVGSSTAKAAPSVQQQNDTTEAEVLPILPITTPISKALISFWDWISEEFSEEASKKREMSEAKERVDKLMEKYDGDYDAVIQELNQLHEDALEEEEGWEALGVLRPMP